jgi:hypothetical protein
MRNAENQGSMCISPVKRSEITSQTLPNFYIDETNLVSTLLATCKYLITVQQREGGPVDHGKSDMVPCTNCENPCARASCFHSGSCSQPQIKELRGEGVVTQTTALAKSWV